MACVFYSLHSIFKEGEVRIHDRPLIFLATSVSCLAELRLNTVP